MLNVLASEYHVSMDYLLCGRGTIFHQEQDSMDSKGFEKILEGDKEMHELFSLVSLIPWVRYAVLSHFQVFKLEKRELIEKELNMNPGATSATKL